MPRASIFSSYLRLANRLRQSLYWKLSLTLLWLMIVLAFAQFYFVTEFWRQVSDQVEQKNFLRLADNLAYRFEDLLQNGGTETDLQLIADDLRRTLPTIDIFILNSNGEVITDFSESVVQHEKVPILPLVNFIENIHSPDLPVYAKDPILGEKCIFSASKIRLKDIDWGFLYIVIRSTRGNIFYILLEQNAALIGLVFNSITITLVIGLLGFYLFHVLTRRFYSITNAVNSYSNSDFTKRIDITSNDEVGQLAFAVNHMASTIQTNIAQLQNRDRLRRELISNVSHDLRTPVAVIDGYLELLITNIHHQKADELSRYLNVIASNTASLRRLLNELFELSKLEANEIQPKMEVFSITQLIEDLVLSFRDAANTKDLAISFDFEEIVHPFVKADIGMIERVLANLIQNSIKYTQVGGRISIKLKQLGSETKISISDTGVGISESDIPHVFDRFYREEGSQELNPESTGLGLAIVKRIIELHQKSIQVESTKGQGTTFSFELDMVNEVSFTSVDAKE